MSKLISKNPPFIKKGGKAKCGYYVSFKCPEGEWLQKRIIKNVKMVNEAEEIKHGQSIYLERSRSSKVPGYFKAIYPKGMTRKQFRAEVMRATRRDIIRAYPDSDERILGAIFHEDYIVLAWCLNISDEEVLYEKEKIGGGADVLVLNQAGKEVPKRTKKVLSQFNRYSTPAYWMLTSGENKLKVVWVK